jgi:hypothetical protein
VEPAALQITVDRLLVIAGERKNDARAATSTTIAQERFKGSCCVISCPTMPTLAASAPSAWMLCVTVPRR